MPTYQYACTAPDCGTEFELVQSFTDPAASACPQCGGAVRKVFSAVGVVFKGSGFYRTDSRAGNGKGSGSSGAEKSAKNGSAGKDSAPAAGSSSATSGAKSGSASGSSSSTGASSPSPAAASA